jgi:transposase
VLTFGSSSRVFVAAAPVDLRRGHDGLCAAVRATLGRDPYAGDLFVFFGRRAHGIKVLYWQRGGFIVHYKRLEQGRFRLPRIEEGAAEVVLDGTALTMLLDGIDLRCVRRPTHWEPSRPGEDKDGPKKEK